MTLLPDGAKSMSSIVPSNHVDNVPITSAECYKRYMVQDHPPHNKSYSSYLSLAQLDSLYPGTTALTPAASQPSAANVVMKDCCPPFFSTIGHPTSRCASGGLAAAIAARNQPSYLTNPVATCSPRNLSPSPTRSSTRYVCPLKKKVRNFSQTCISGKSAVQDAYIQCKLARITATSYIEAERQGEDVCYEEDEEYDSGLDGNASYSTSSDGFKAGAAAFNKKHFIFRKWLTDEECGLTAENNFITKRDGTVVIDKGTTMGITYKKQGLVAGDFTLYLMWLKRNRCARVIQMFFRFVQFSKRVFALQQGKDKDALEIYAIYAKERKNQKTEDKKEDKNNSNSNLIFVATDATQSQKKSSSDNLLKTCEDADGLSATENATGVTSSEMRRKSDTDNSKDVYVLNNYQKRIMDEARERAAIRIQLFLRTRWAINNQPCNIKLSKKPPHDVGSTPQDESNCVTQQKVPQYLGQKQAAITINNKTAENLRRSSLDANLENNPEDEKPQKSTYDSAEFLKDLPNDGKEKVAINVDNNISVQVDNNQRYRKHFLNEKESALLNNDTFERENNNNDNNSCTCENNGNNHNENKLEFVDKCIETEDSPLLDIGPEAYRDYIENLRRNRQASILQRRFRLRKRMRLDLERQIKKRVPKKIDASTSTTSIDLAGDDTQDVDEFDDYSEAEF